LEAFTWVTMSRLRNASNLHFNKHTAQASQDTYSTHAQTSQATERL